MLGKDSAAARIVSTRTAFRVSEQRERRSRSRKTEIDRDLEIFTGIQLTFAALELGQVDRVSCRVKTAFDHVSDRSSDFRIQRLPGSWLWRVIDEKSKLGY